MSFKSNLPKNEPAKAESLKTGSINNDLKESSNMTANKKKNNSFRKWLPAIIFASLLHIALLILFILNENKSSDKVNETSVSNIEAKTIDRNINNVDGSEPLPTTTITDNQDAKADSVSDMDMDTNKKETLPNESSPTKHQESDGLAINKDKSISVKDNEFKPSPTNQAILDHVTNQASTLDMEPRKVRSINPNDAVLLSRDLPSSKANTNGVDDEYAKKAQQIEEINSKISDAIQAVKQQNINKIESHKRQLEIAKSELKTKDTVGKVVVSQKVKTDNSADEEKAVESRQTPKNDTSNTPNNTTINPSEPSSKSSPEAPKTKAQAKDNGEQDTKQINDTKQPSDGE